MNRDEIKLSELTLGEFKEWFTCECKSILKEECDLLYTYEQACIILCISKGLLYKLIHLRKLHPIKQHGNVQKFIKASELHRFQTDKALYIK